MEKAATIYQKTSNNRRFDPENFIISQSTIKEYLGYVDKYNPTVCGIQFQNLLEGKITQKTSDDMKLGIYFEYKATGGLPKDGQIPEPKVYQKSGPTYTKGDTKGDYIHAEEQAKVFKETLDKLGFDVVSAGERIIKDNREGTIDLIAKARTIEDYENLFKRIPGIKEYPISEGLLVQFDLKFSGKMDDKWDGWIADSFDEIKDKDKAIQAIHYSSLNDTVLPFFFWIFDSKKPGNKMIYVRFPDDAIEDWNIQAEACRINIIRDFKSGGFAPKPSGSRCAICPLSDQCKHFTIIPDIEVADFMTPQI